MITKEELKNTYIKYSSAITEEIFDKIIDKLEEFGFEKYSDGSRNKEYKYFVREGFPYLRIDHKYWFIASVEAYKEIQVSDIIGENNQFEVGKWYKVPETSNYIVKYEFNDRCSEYIDNKGLYNKFGGRCNYKNAKEVSLEEIQQYLPDGHVDKIIKEFVLPEKWCVESTETTIKILNDFIKSKGYKHSLLYYTYCIHYPFLNGKYSAYDSIQDGYTEITFDQFKQYVLKESVKEVKSIEKWYVGSYVVPLQDRLLSRPEFLTKGKPYEITKLLMERIPYIIDNDGSEINFKTDFKDAEATQGIKWFPTLAEAEDFSKSLLEPKPLTVDDLIEGEIYKAQHK